jgi:hypothetical protein
LVGGLSLNSWRGKETVQILIKDLACRHFQVLDWRGDPGGDTPDYRPGPDELILDETILPEDFDISELMRKRRPGTVLIRLNRNRPIWERHLNKEGIGSVFRLLQKRPETNRETLEAEAKIPPWVLSPSSMCWKNSD